MAIWHLSPRTMVKRLRRWPDLASACGYCALNIISASQLYRRRDRLGLWVYFITFCALVWQLIQLDIIVGCGYRLHGERDYIERLFALLKRYYGLNDVQVIGFCKVWRHTFEVCIAVLTVAWLAVDIGRPELMHSKSRLLAPC